MNPKIKEIAEQAMWHTNTKTGEVYRTHFQFEKRFAELIIRECAEKIAHNEKFNWLDAAQAAKDLKENFGIE